MLTGRAEVLCVPWLTLSTGVGALFLHTLYLFPSSPHSSLMDSRVRRGEGVGEKQGEGHVAAHCLRGPLPPTLDS